jgi:inner membrane protein
MAFALFFGLLFVDDFSENKVLFLFLVLISGMLPDIDHPRSKIGKKFWFLSKPFSFLFGHRKLFHSVFLAVILGVVIWKSLGIWWMPIFLGYFSHILIDGFTLEGINFIYPIKQLRLQGFIETGKKQETFLFYGLVLIDILLLYRVFF